jgi:hypothetical protein
LDVTVEDMTGLPWSPPCWRVVENSALAILTAD